MLPSNEPLMCAIFELLLLLFEALVLFRAELLRLEADRFAVARLGLLRLTLLCLVVLRLAALRLALARRADGLFLAEDRLDFFDRADGMCFTPTYFRKCDSLFESEITR